MELPTALLLFLVGLFTGALGALIGLAGGFLLVPILLFLYPQDSPKTITSVSLVVVLFSALSGTSAYARMRRIDYRTGMTFALATIPGAILGVLTTGLLSRGVFQLIFGMALLAIAGYLLARAGTHPRPFPIRATVQRTITDRYGITQTYSFNLRLGILVSFAAGFISSLLGIGGGILHVPALIALFNFPVHLATATSQFIVAFTAFAGTVTHLVTREYFGAYLRPLVLAAGAILGAQIGARLSPRVQGSHIVRLLALALGIVGLRLIVGTL